MRKLKNTQLAMMMTTVLAATSACTNDVNVDDDSMAIENSVNDAAIRNGEPAREAHHRAVVGLLPAAFAQPGSFTLDSFCTGTLITEDVVITAAHCLNGSNSSFFFIEKRPSEVGIYFGDNPTTDNDPFVVGVTEVWVHPQYDPNNILNDIGLLRLDRAVDASVATPIPALPGALGLNGGDIGSKLEPVGFGQDENGNSDEKLRTFITLGGFGCAVTGCEGAQDDPNTQFSWDASQTGTCFGDSGGPFFVIRDGQHYVAGLTSYGNSDCTQFGVATKVDAFQAQVDDFIGVDNGGDAPVNDSPIADDPADDEPIADQPIADEPVDDDPIVDEPIADEPVGGATCGDGVCSDGESCDGRSGNACPADCDQLSTGNWWEEYCFVDGQCEGFGCFSL